MAAGAPSPRKRAKKIDWYKWIAGIGADMDLTWDAQPNMLYYVQVGQRYNSSGSYTLTVR